MNKLSIRFGHINRHATSNAAQMSIELVTDATGNVEIKTQPGGDYQVLMSTSIDADTYPVRNKIHGDGLPVENSAEDARDVANRNMIRVRDDLYGTVGQVQSSL
jgi:hypothetical protein